MKNTDIKILKLLQNDASISISKIAEKVNLSESSCWRRVNSFQQKGIIKRNIALLDREKLGMDVVVFAMISLVSQTGNALQDFESRIQKFPEILECYTMTGEMDYILKIITKDIRHYEEFVRGQLSQLPNIREFHSHIAVTKIKDSLELPLDTQI